MHISPTLSTARHKRVTPPRVRTGMICSWSVVRAAVHVPEVSDDALSIHQKAVNPPENANIYLHCDRSHLWP